MGRDRPVYDSFPHPVYGVVGFVGELFLWGAAGGATVGFARGLFGAPSGARLAGAVHAARANAPRVAVFGAYSAAFSAVEAAVSRARGGSKDMWCSVSASAAVWGMHYSMRGGSAPAAAGGALLGVAGILELYGVDHAGMVWQSRRADAESLLRQKRMMDRGQPTPVAIAASRTAVPASERPAVEMLFAKHE